MLDKLLDILRRELKKTTKTEMAERLDMTRVSLNAILDGSEAITLRTIRKIGDELGWDFRISASKKKKS